MTTHRLSFTLVWFTAQDKDLSYIQLSKCISTYGFHCKSAGSEELHVRMLQGNEIMAGKSVASLGFHTVHITPMWPLTLCVVQLTMCQGQQQSNEQLAQKLCSDNNQTWICRQCLSLHLQVNFHSLAVIVIL